MAGLSAGDRYLLEEIRQGNQDGWVQLVDRYQGRLIAFARSQMRGASECEDLVQEVFLQFLQRLDSFREETSLETFLFMILRRRMIDFFRRQGRSAVTACSLQETLGRGSHVGWEIEQVADDQQSVSRYAMRHEAAAEQQQALRGALEELVAQLQQQLKFRDLQVLELIFYAQLRNKDIALLMDIDEKQVALLKHRMIQRLAGNLANQPNVSGEPLQDTMLTQLWEELRPSCPKRSTLGKAVLGTLDPDWQAYVDFHLQQLGCRFCQANMLDLQPERSQSARRDPLCDRILQSSVGFFRPRS